MTVRAMTWNVWWRFGPRWRERQVGLLSTIRSSGADVIVLAESWGTPSESQAGRWAQSLGFHAAFSSPSLPPVPHPLENQDQAGIEIGIGLLSRWPIQELRRIPLPTRHRPQTPISVVASVAHPSGPLHVIGTCLEWEPAYNDDRIAQAQAVTDLATDPRLDGPAPVLVMGDLNAAPDSPVLRPLRDALRDAWTVGGGDPAAVTLRSDHPFAPRAAELIDQRIDHIFFRPGQPGQEVTVAEPHLAGDPVEGLDPSDHKAVVADLSWTNPR